MQLVEDCKRVNITPSKTGDSKNHNIIRNGNVTKKKKRRGKRCLCAGKYLQCKS